MQTKISGLFKLTDLEEKGFDILMDKFGEFKQENKEYLKGHGDVKQMIIFLMKFKLI